MNTEKKVTPEEIGRVLKDQAIADIADEKNSAIIDKATDRESLFDAIEQLGSIKGSDVTFDSRKLVELAEKALDGEIPLNTLPRTHGFRKKVDALREKELINLGLASKGRPADKLDHPEKLF